MQQRLGRGEPLAARHQDADAEQRVELVAREREMVDPERVHVDRHVRGELGGIDADLRAVVVRQLGELADGEDLPRDVRGAGDREEVVAAARQRRRAVRQELVGRRRERQQVDLAPAPGEHVRVVLAGVERTRAPAGRQCASRLSASVVLRTNTTTWSSAAPTKVATAARAAS